MSDLLYSSIFILILFSSCAHDWRNADKGSANIAPLPKDEPQAIVEIYAARAVKWRGIFAVHTWIATKEKGASTYTTFQVIGFRLKRTGSAVVIEDGIPDGKWYGKVPDLIFEIKGERAETAIPKIRKLAHSYPYHDHYRAWPGPNSNTFVSYIIRNVDELGVELPPHAIGKDWINDGDLVGFSETGTGVQFSLFGALGLTLGAGEGFEINFLGLSFGIDVLRPAFKLPLAGRLGFEDAPVFD